MVIVEARVSGQWIKLHIRTSERLLNHHHLSSFSFNHLSEETQDSIPFLTLYHNTLAISYQYALRQPPSAGFVGDCHLPPKFS